MSRKRRLAPLPEPDFAQKFKMEQRARNAQRDQAIFDALTPEERAFIHKWGKNAYDRLVILGWSLERAEKDLRAKYQEPIRT